MNENEFRKSLTNLGLNYESAALTKLKEYANYLLEYNKHTNLTAIKNLDEVYLKHFYDSLTLVKTNLLDKPCTFLDVGTGAGFPGLVIKIFFPHIHVVLLDSNHKKTDFLKEVIAKLELKDIEVINDRVENYAKTHLNSFDIISSRAVANLTILSELILPLVKLNGTFLAMKANIQEELEDALFCITKMGGEVTNVLKCDLPSGGGKRNIIMIRKNKVTSEHELRAYEKIIKKPLQKKGK